MPTHSIIDSQGVSVRVGNGADLLPLLTTQYPYGKGYRLVEITGNFSSGEGKESAIGAERIQRHENKITELAISAGVDAEAAKGFAKTKTAWGLTAGTTLIDIGKENLNKSFNRHLRMGKLVDQLAAMEDKIAGEHRQDFHADIRDLRMLPSGKLFRMMENGTQTHQIDNGDGQIIEVKGGGHLEIEEQVFPQLSAVYDGELPGAARVLTRLRPDRRARVFNGQVSEYANNFTGDRAPVKKLRTRNGEGPRSVFGIVSEGYRVIDSDTVCRIQREALVKNGLGELRGETTYFPESTILRTSGTIHADPKATIDFGAGDIFEFGIWTKTGDVGNSGISGGLHFRRNGCLNLIVVYHEKLKSFSIHHKGTLSDAELQLKVEREMSKLAALQVAAMEIFQKDWGVLRNTPVSQVVNPLNDNDRPLTAMEVVRAIANERALDRLAISVKSRRELVPVFAGLQNREEVMVKAFEAEPGDSAADVVNAVTRAWEFVPVEQREDWEVAGGMLARALSDANA